MSDASSNDLPLRLRHALEAADFTYDTVADLLGPLAHQALARNETTPGLRRTAGGGPLETLVRLFLLQTPVELAAAEAALPGLVDRMAAEGLVEQSIGEVAARLDVRPYGTDDGHLWVVSDLTPGLDGGPNRVGPDHVLGISSASTSLAQLTLREPVGSALDLGTGCGVQALHLAAHSERVVATDVNTRALRLARFNAALNGVAGSRRRTRGLVLRAGRGGALRPDRHQPAVRHLAGDWGAAGLPRLRAARGQRRRAHRAHRAPTPQRGWLVPGARQLGDPAGPLLAGPDDRLVPRRL